MKTDDFATLAARLNSAVLSDVLDDLGLVNQAMRPFVRPLDDSLSVFGRARTGLYMNTYSVKEHGNPYEVEIALVDDLKPGDIAVLACDGPTARIAPWGELLTTASRMRGAVGCVTDGLVRDVRLIRDMQFPVFAGGIGPLDSKGRGKMMAMDVPVNCGGALVNTGDLVFGDVDGVVVIPADVADSVIGAALSKLESESKTRAELLNGALLAEVYARHGVL
ncbi:Regulator of RNase E activity RraA [Nitratireductor aquibiodomus]|uniref:Putative 4-hydroxy-4-methyl-2-oxoglutarate aldolase n=1 Tax=Nitratireductor aquibiodomus TaxID=204799 RepID=A0A1H4KFR5_9HYPH|nr:RraA family protein [Nitratireductor aquibiodomus]SEB56965.1 Regulator of RNase E activity RraA [Nitratireductor aquibiodomus]